jgi:hypothetical protein
MWKLLERLKTCFYAPWLVIGDFNAVMWNFEHFSSHRRPARRMLDFHEVLSHCDLHDPGFAGLPWTSSIKKPGTATSGLDWIEQWPHRAGLNGSLRFVPYTLFHQALTTVPSF